jgi:hypothetical protein
LNPHQKEDVKRVRYILEGFITGLRFAGITEIKDPSEASE